MLTFYDWILHAESERSRAERRRSLGAVGASFLGAAFMMAIMWTGCATTTKGRVHQAAVIQKTVVDGVGNAYLNYCEVVRKPTCVAEDKAATEKGTPQTKEQRVACLRPCDSATAKKIQTAVDIVRTEQSLLFELLHGGNATDEELKAQRQQLARAAQQLNALIRESGVVDMLGNAVGAMP
ncbi:MAG: hypothetical protein K0U16_07490 [Gammaproteobacteria bacterium]|nr:hypothetical protein [Gammaproteobacteria bacterium]